MPELIDSLFITSFDSFSKHIGNTQLFYFRTFLCVKGYRQYTFLSKPDSCTRNEAGRTLHGGWQ